MNNKREIFCNRTLPSPQVFGGTCDNKCTNQMFHLTKEHFPYELTIIEVDGKKWVRPKKNSDNFEFNSRRNIW